MIRKSKQIWEVNASVQVGFMTLVVMAKVETPGDWKPDAYILASSKGVLYVFVPHNGLSKSPNQNLEELITLVARGVY